jgi:uroporphyrinogen-III synthase|tara:strand:- start:3581 stop:4243 length:663 start_codon:yes stop_codon:yes gene_type:complete
MKQITILSTVKLEEKNKKLFEKNNIKLIQHEFINTSSLEFKLPNHNGNWIFTSKNAVKAVYSSKEKIKCDKMPHYCVGENTKSLLLKNGQKVIKTAINSYKLALFIQKNAKNEHFNFCRGSIKNINFSKFFEKNEISLSEIPVYKTSLTPKNLNMKFDGIMFFSPSAVESFNQKNNIGDSFCFCIGKTTSSFAKNFTNNILESKTPSINNVINQTINYFK